MSLVLSDCVSVSGFDSFCFCFCLSLFCFCLFLQLVFIFSVYICLCFHLRSVYVTGYACLRFCLCLPVFLRLICVSLCVLCLWLLLSMPAAAYASVSAFDMSLFMPVFICIGFSGRVAKEAPHSVQLISLTSDRFSPSTCTENKIVLEHSFRLFFPLQQ